MTELTAKRTGVVPLGMAATNVQTPDAFVVHVNVPYSEPSDRRTAMTTVAFETGPDDVVSVRVIPAFQVGPGGSLAVGAVQAAVDAVVDVVVVVTAAVVVVGASVVVVTMIVVDVVVVTARFWQVGGGGRSEMQSNSLATSARELSSSAWMTTNDPATRSASTSAYSTMVAPRSPERRRDDRTRPRDAANR